MFYKFKMNENRYGRLYDYVIIEAEEEQDAYDRALGQLPLIFGGVDEEAFAEEVTTPLSEPWPIFSEAFFSREMADDEARLARNTA